MGILKRTLPGTSMVEAIVAALIFILIFAISLSTLTGLTTREDEGYLLLEAERQLAACGGRYGDGTWAEGTYTDTFAWGTITTCVSLYGDYGKIQQVAMRAELHGSHKIIIYRCLTVKVQ